MNKIEEIKEYISLLENSSLSVLEIEKEDGTKIHLEKEHPAQQIFNASPIGAYQPTATDVPAPAPVQPQAPAAQSAAPEEDAKTVNAPIVGGITPSLRAITEAIASIAPVAPRR